MLTFDHLAADGASIDLVVRELLTVYTALIRDPGKDPSAVLGELSHQYCDWAAEQWRLIEGEYASSLRNYWARRLEGAQDLILPTDRIASTDFAPLTRSDGELDSSLLERVTAFAREMRITPAMTLLSILFSLLHRTTGQADLSVAVPADARRHQVARVVGFFTLPLIVRVPIQHGLRFRELCRAVSSTLIDAYNWGRAPLYTVVSPSRGLWRLGFNFYRSQSMPAGDLRVRGGSPPARRECLDLDLSLRVREVPEENRLIVSLMGRDDVFDRSAVQTLLRRYIELAADLLVSPDQPVGRA